MNFLFAFLIGGALCLIAQLLIDLTSLTPARILVLYVVGGVFLGAIGLYEPLFDIAGSGVSVPLIGFGGNIAKGVRDAVDAEGALGILKGAFYSSAIGCSVSLLSALILSLIFKSKPKSKDF